MARQGKGRLVRQLGMSKDSRGIGGTRPPISKEGQTILRCTFFREHDTEADAWTEKGARGPEEEWEDDVEVALSDVTGICGF